MRRLTWGFMALATPAMAHDGFHFHPHGGEIALGLLVALVGGIVLLWVRR
jgi:hypothetical protein